MTAGLACLPHFALRPDQLATAPPEARGTARDGVRLLVAEADRPLQHRTASDLPSVLRPGDLLVVNISDTLPAAVSAVGDDGIAVEIHLSTVDPGSGMPPAAALAARQSQWIVEFRIPAPPASRQTSQNRLGQTYALRGGGRFDVLNSCPGGRETARLWVGVLRTPAPLRDWLGEHGQPVRYDYVSAPWPLSSYRTTYASVPGSAEMPSAGRALTDRLLRHLQVRGIERADVVLHCGLSSVEAGEAPTAEWFTVPVTTVDAVRRTRARGGRVIAVGTTVVRALESALDGCGELTAMSGWTELMIGPERAVSTVDGLLTGWHEPQATHLLMLQALAGPDLLCRSYAAALEQGYQWHEFGDLHLLIPA